MASPFNAYQAAGNAVCVITKPASAVRKGEQQGLKELKLQVHIVEQESGRAACCKADGLRFAGADTTVKLRQDATYVISITSMPAVAISVDEAEVKHRQAECAEPSALCCCLPHAADGYADLSLQEWSAPARVPLKERSTASSAAKATFELAWDCSMALTKRGVRGELALDVAVQGFGCVTVPIMSKVYAHGDTSAAHGQPLHSITYTYGRSGLTGDVKMHSVRYNK